MPQKPKNKTVMWGLIDRVNGTITYADEFKPKKGQHGDWETSEGSSIHAATSIYRLARVEVREIKKR
jgi:hypothetical protein